MKKTLLAIALLTVSSVAHAQKLSADMMVSTTTKGDKLAVSLVSHPVLSVELGKLKVAGVVLPSMIMDKNFTKHEPSLGVGLVTQVKKIGLGYSTFKLSTGWKNFIGVNVKF